MELIRSAKTQRESNTSFRPMTTQKHCKTRRLSQNLDSITIGSAGYENDKMSVRTIPYSSVRSHRNLLFIPSEKYMNNYSPMKLKDGAYKPNYDSIHAKTKSVFIPTTRSEAVSLVLKA